MSYQIILSGHSSEPHNEEVKAIAEDAFKKLSALPGSSGVSLSGYSNDNTGSTTLSDPTAPSTEPDHGIHENPPTP